MITIADVMQSNGVIHVVNKVLIPGLRVPVSRSTTAYGIATRGRPHDRAPVAFVAPSLILPDMTDAPSTPPNKSLGGAPLDPSALLVRVATAGFRKPSQSFIG